LRLLINTHTVRAYLQPKATKPKLYLRGHPFMTSTQRRWAPGSGGRMRTGVVEDEGSGSMWTFTQKIRAH